MATIAQSNDNYMLMPNGSNQEDQQANMVFTNNQPLLGRYKSSTTQNKSIFQITKEELKMFFEKKNMKKPDNEGEARISLNMLKDVNYNAGLCRRLSSDPETGIIGDDKDLKRR